MIVLLRYIREGQGQTLPQFDLEKFSENQVRNRLSELGISDRDCYVSDIVDWNLNRIMSLGEAYRLKDYVSELYDGDNYLVNFMLKSGISFEQIFSNYYVYLGKDEEGIMERLLEHAEISSLIKAFKRAGTWVNFVMSYVNAGYIVNTPKGFYIQSDFLY